MRSSAIKIVLSHRDFELSLWLGVGCVYRGVHVRFGSEADICMRKVMSALHPKADMCGALGDVR